MNKLIKSYTVTQKENNSIASGMISSEYHNKSLSDSNKGEDYSEDSRNAVEKSRTNNDGWHFEGEASQ